MEEGKREGLRKKTEKEREALMQRLERLADQEEILREDYRFLSMFVSAHGKQLTKAQQEYEQDKAALMELERGQEMRRQKLEEREERLRQTETDLQRLTAQEMQIGEAIEKLKELEGIIQTTNSLKIEENSLRAKLEAVQKEKEEMEEKQKIVRESERKNREKAEITRNKKEQMEADWERLYGPYEKDGHRAVRQGLTLEELEVRFLGRKEAFEKEHGDIEDKKLLVENLKTGMERTLSAIEYRGDSPKRLQAAFEANELKRTAKEELLALHKKLSESQEAEEVAARQLQGQTDSVNRKFGSIGHAKTMVEEQFGSFETIEEGEDLRDRLTAERRLLAEKKERQRKSWVKKKNWSVNVLRWKPCVRIWSG